MIENKKVEVKTVGEHRAGDVCELKVVRQNEMGAFLDAGTGNTSDDILLHKQQQDSPVQVGDIVKVYLYLDPHGRMTASRKLPKMREGQLGYVKVLSVTRDGGFVDIGAERGVFLPYSEMRGHVSPGQLVWAKLYRDKTGRQAVSMRVEEEMLRASKPAVDVKVGDEITGTVYNILPEGFFLITMERYIAFIHRSEVPGGRLDFGQKVTGRIAFVREDGRLNLSLRPQKEQARVLDADLILSLLEKRKGSMPYGDDTPAEVIKDVFGISKSGFKRALGKLMKDGKVKQENGWTTLIEE
ncbi:Conserved virulence factor B [bioreactor metagenome]|uniref:Conserved virulence factor B n=1 Tax=bioreactor metagenome TaxID=1076179 RepID=A0A645CQX6_9ZZZZ